MATFPDITQAPIGSTPISTQVGNYDDLTSLPQAILANADKAVIVGSSGFDYSPILRDQYGIDLANVLASSGILRGMELSIGSPTNTLDIAQGAYVTKTEDFGGQEDYEITPFAGATGLPVSNPANAWFLYVNIDRLGNVLFEEDRACRVKACLGGIEVKGTTTIYRVYNNGTRLKNSGDQFDLFLSDLGVFQKSIVVGLRPNGNIQNTAGTVYSGSLYKGKFVQASTNQKFQIIDDESSFGPERTTITVQELKVFKEPGQPEQTLTGNNQFGIWFIFVNLEGKFLFLKPQAETSPVSGTTLTNADVYNAYEKLVYGEIIKSDSTLVGALTIEGNANSISDVTVLNLVNVPLSSSEGSSIVPPTAQSSVSVPSPTLSDEIKRGRPAVGAYQLGIDISGQYDFIRGLEGLTDAPDGLLYQPMRPYKEYPSMPNLATLQLEWANTGTIIKPKIWYLANYPAKVKGYGGTAALFFYPGAPNNNKTNIPGLDAGNSFSSFIMYSDQVGTKGFKTTYGNLRGNAANKSAYTAFIKSIPGKLGLPADALEYGPNNKVLPFFMLNNPVFSVAGTSPIDTSLTQIRALQGLPADTDIPQFPSSSPRYDNRGPNSGADEIKTLTAAMLAYSAYRPIPIDVTDFDFPAKWTSSIVATNKEPQGNSLPQLIGGKNTQPGSSFTTGQDDAIGVSTIIGRPPFENKTPISSGVFVFIQHKA